MKAQELRIGNFVWEDYGGYYEVTQIRGSDVYLKKIGMTATGSYLVDNIAPIPLTQEWLLKFGFNKTSGEYFNFYNESFCLEVFRTSLPVNEWEYRFRAYGNETKILYVHQLQNLHYTLTGRELTVLEKK